MSNLSRLQLLIIDVQYCSECTSFWNHWRMQELETYVYNYREAWQFVATTHTHIVTFAKTYLYIFPRKCP